MRCISEGLLETVGLEITIVSVRARAGAHSKSWWERVPDFRSRSAEAADVK